MIEIVNPSHPDKIADRIAGAMVDLAYKNQVNPKVAIEVLIGHGDCFIVGESSYNFTMEEIAKIVGRIAGFNFTIRTQIVEQDEHLANNQKDKIRCGDNGIFKGVPLTEEEKLLAVVANQIYNKYPYDGKYILSTDKLVICQSNAKSEDIKKDYGTNQMEVIVNPLGDWTGGTDVDTGATNRKLGSDMGRSVTGGGLHGKDLSKADVSVNIYAFKKAQETGKEVNLCCAIGDTEIDGKPYSEIVKEAKEYIESIGGFEKFAEWGLLRAKI